MGARKDRKLAARKRRHEQVIIWLERWHARGVRENVEFLPMVWLDEIVADTIQIQGDRRAELELAAHELRELLKIDIEVRKDAQHDPTIDIISLLGEVFNRA